MGIFIVLAAVLGIIAFSRGISGNTGYGSIYGQNNRECQSSWDELQQQSIQQCQWEMEQQFQFQRQIDFQQAQFQQQMELQQQTEQQIELQQQAEFQQNIIDRQNQEFNDYSVQESMNSVTPFEHGGYDMDNGNSFNDWNNMNDFNMF